MKTVPGKHARPSAGGGTGGGAAGGGGLRHGGSSEARMRRRQSRGRQINGSRPAGGGPPAAGSPVGPVRARPFPKLTIARAGRKAVHSGRWPCGSAFSAAAARATPPCSRPTTRGCWWMPVFREAAGGAARRATARSSRTSTPSSSPTSTATTPRGSPGWRATRTSRSSPTGATALALQTGLKHRVAWNLLRPAARSASATSRSAVSPCRTTRRIRSVSESRTARTTCSRRAASLATTARRCSRPTPSARGRPSSGSAAGTATCRTRARASCSRPPASPRWRHVFLTHLSRDCNSPAAVERGGGARLAALPCGFSVVGAGAGTPFYDFA